MEPITVRSRSVRVVTSANQHYQSVVAGLDGSFCVDCKPGTYHFSVCSVSFSDYFEICLEYLLFSLFIICSYFIGFHILSQKWAFSMQQIKKFGAFFISS